MTGIHTENLAYLDQALDDVQPSPVELLTMLNLMVGALAARMDEETWKGIVDRAVLRAHETRGTTP